MSWSELERLVEEAESDGTLRRALSHCRSSRELLLACRHLGYGIESRDLRLARELHRRGSDPTVHPAFDTEACGSGAERTHSG